jgi:hypothetical protein
MTRITSFLALGALACAAAIGAAPPQTTTYVDGNLTGIAPNTGATLLFSGDAAMSLRAGATSVVVPYESIGKVELGVTKVHSHDVPLYRVWSLHKRFTGKTRTQYLTVVFKDNGEDKTMTLELAQANASDVVATIQSHTSPGVVAARVATSANPAGSEWWGDEYWKTTRNVDRWNKTVAANGPEK